MDLIEQRMQRIDHLIDKLSLGDRETIEVVGDLLLWGFYGQDVFSQFGYGLCGWVFRQQRDFCVATIKVVENGVPLVAFVSSTTPRGSIRKAIDLLYQQRLSWQKDKFPWI